MRNIYNLIVDVSENKPCVRHLVPNPKKKPIHFTTHLDAGLD